MIFVMPACFLFGCLKFSFENSKENSTVFQSCLKSSRRSPPRLVNYLGLEIFCCLDLVCRSPTGLKGLKTPPQCQSSHIVETNFSIFKWWYHSLNSPKWVQQITKKPLAIYRVVVAPPSNTFCQSSPLSPNFDFVKKVPPVRLIPKASEAVTIILVCNDKHGPYD